MLSPAESASISAYLVAQRFKEIINLYVSYDGDKQKALIDIAKQYYQVNPDALRIIDADLGWYFFDYLTYDYEGKSAEVDLEEFSKIIADQNTFVRQCLTEGKLGLLIAFYQLHSDAGLVKIREDIVAYYKEDPKQFSQQEKGKTLFDLAKEQECQVLVEELNKAEAAFVEECLSSKQFQELIEFYMACKPRQAAIREKIQQYYIAKRVLPITETNATAKTIFDFIPENLKTLRKMLDVFIIFNYLNWNALEKLKQYHDAGTTARRSEIKASILAWEDFLLVKLGRVDALLTKFPFHCFYVTPPGIGFDITRNAEKAIKKALIMDGPVTGGLTLHQRQSLAERLIAARATNLEAILGDRVWPKCTYLIVNLGLVVTDRPHVKEGDHKRRFVTIPVVIEDFTLVGGAVANEHAEEVLTAHLLAKAPVAELVRSLKREYGIKAGYKVYAAVLDIHGTYDMCVSCYTFIYNALYDLKKNLAEQLVAAGLILPANKRPQMIVRYTSNFKYDYPDGHSKCYSDKARGSLVRYGTDRLERDIEPGEDLIIHGNAGWRGLWSVAFAAAVAKPVKLENWTAIGSTSAVSGISETDRKYAYTFLGEVPEKSEAVAATP